MEYFCNTGLGTPGPHQIRQLETLQGAKTRLTLVYSYWDLMATFLVQTVKILLRLCLNVLQRGHLYPTDMAVRNTACARDIARRVAGQRNVITVSRGKFHKKYLLRKLYLWNNNNTIFLMSHFVFLY